MRVFVVSLSLLFAVSVCNGFVSETASARSIATLRAAPKDAEVTTSPDLRQTLTSVAVATALGWGLASGAAFAVDYADFSLPSYEAVTKAEINSNLKGDNFLFGDASKPMISSSGADSPEAAAPEVKEKTADELKADKAARRAADKEARLKQQAAIEAAAAAKASQ